MIRSADVLMPYMSRYNVLHHFCRKLREALTRAGIEGRLLEGSEIFSGLQQSVPDFTIAFNGAPNAPSGGYHFDKLHIPHISLLVDPPNRFSNLFHSPYSLIGCDDHSGKRFLNSIGFKKGFFLPHAVEPELLESSREEKVFDIALIATFIDIEEQKKRWSSEFSTNTLKKLDQTIEIIFSDSPSSIIEAYFGKEEVKATAEHLHALQELEMYVKGKERIDLVKSIGDLTLHIFGGTVDKRTWRDYFPEQKNLRIYPEIDFQQVIQVMKQTRILLNSSLKNKEGAHERIFYGLACDAMVVTNESLFLRESFGDEDGLIFYSMKNKELLEEKIQSYLKDEEKFKNCIKNGKQIVKNSHTWDCRVKDILKQVELSL